MKTNLGRIAVLTALNKPKAYALYNGFIERQFIGGTGRFIGKAMLASCMAHGFLAEGKAPRAIRDKYLGVVWRITDKGRDWLAQAKFNVDSATQRLAAENVAKEKAELEFNIRERAKQIARQRVAKS